MLVAFYSVDFHFAFSRHWEASGALWRTHSSEGESEREGEGVCLSFTNVNMFVGWTGAVSLCVFVLPLRQKCWSSFAWKWSCRGGTCFTCVMCVQLYVCLCENSVHFWTSGMRKAELIFWQSAGVRLGVCEGKVSVEALSCVRIGDPLCDSVSSQL